MSHGAPEWASAQFLFSAAFTQGPLEDYPLVMNPYGCMLPIGISSRSTALGFLLLLIGIGGSVASLVLRFRRARAMQRQQIKWLAAAGAIRA